MKPVAKEGLPWPGDRAELVPLLPFVYCVWADGSLSTTELEQVSTAVEGLDWLTEDARGVLEAWLDPEAPPTPSDLSEIRTHLRSRALHDANGATRSLTDLGLALWSTTGDGGPWASPEARGALRALESGLGWHGPEAARGALGRPPSPAREPSPHTAAFDGASPCVPTSTAADSRYGTASATCCPSLSW